jgi:hypothetical protein
VKKTDLQRKDRDTRKTQRIDPYKEYEKETRKNQL